MMKYDQIKYLKKTRARTIHQCEGCGKLIEPGEYYYVEALKGRVHHIFNSRFFCSKCYEEYGDQLLKTKKTRIFKHPGSLNDYIKSP